MRYDLSVIASCFNESKNVVELTERLLKTFAKQRIAGEVILVDDASTDDTGKLIKELARRFPNVQALGHEKNQRLFAGWKTGLAASRGVYVCLIDADLQNLSEDVGRLYQEITFSGADLVQGRRSHIGRLSESFPRYLASRGLNFLLNLLFSMRSRDNKSGFVIARKEILNEILSYRYSYYYPQTFVGVSAKHKGYSIRQIETLFQDRRLGSSFLSKVPLKASWLTFLDILKGFFEFRFFSPEDTSLRGFLATHPPVRIDEPLPFWRRFYFQIYLALFPLHHWMISYNAGRYYEDLKRSQWLSLETIREYQLLALRRLLAHSYYHVPFYREMFDTAKLRPEDIKTFEDFQKLPIIDKRVVRENIFLGFLADNHDKRYLQKIQTSGSTGEPFFTFAEKRQLEMRWAATQRAFDWTGYRFGDRQLRLWHRYLGMKPSETVREVVDAWLTRRRFIPAYEIGDDNIRDYIKTIMRAKPVLLDGYAESFNLMARFLKQLAARGEFYRGPRPKAIMSSAQTLPDESRKIIEEAFGCGVYDKYGGREFAGGIAYQCRERDGYHVVAECNIVEIIKDGRPAKPGEVGEIIVTELNNYALPLLRYRIGDLAQARDPAEKCACGRGLPLIGKIQGRVQAVVVGTNNKFIPGTFFNRVFFKHDAAIRKYQVIQEKFGELRIKMVRANLFHDGVLNEITRDIKEHMGDDLKIRVEFADEIPLGRTGKHQHCISRLDPLEVSRNLDSVKLV